MHRHLRRGKTCLPSRVWQGWSHRKLLLRLGLLCWILGHGFIPAALAADPGQPNEYQQLISDHLKRWLVQYTLPEIISVNGINLLATALIREFYCSGNFQPVWSHDGQVLPQVEHLLQALESSNQDGLIPQDYHTEEIRKIIGSMQTNAVPARRVFDPYHLAALDMLLTDGFFMYAVHLNQGRVDPRTVEKYFPTLENNRHWPGTLAAFLANPAKFSDHLQELVPHSPEYQRLRQALAYYRSIQTELAGVKLEFRGPVLSKGDRDPNAVPMLRTLLKAKGDLRRAYAMDPAIFDTPVEEAVKHFQNRHGLSETGQVDDKTLMWLNLPVEKNILTLEYSLERWRWVSFEGQGPFIRVNIPSLTLEVIDKKEKILTMRVVVGQRYKRTPVFKGELRQIVLNPAWEIPPDIIVTDKLPLIREDPGFLEKHTIEVYEGWGSKEKKMDPKNLNWQQMTEEDFYKRYRLRQLSGPTNPLGKIKFMFPNDFNVYLHDTPQRKLFERDQRFFSSGCIRLEQPIALAEYCLREERLWTRGRIKGALQGKVEQKIRLHNPIPIYILYYTGWVDESEAVQFREDIYERDRVLEKALRKTSPTGR